MVLITKNQAVVILVLPGKFEFVMQVDLPKTVDYRNCDHETLRQLTKINTEATSIDLLIST